MSSNKKSASVQKLGEFLKAPFRRIRSRSSSPSPTAPKPAVSNAPTNTPVTTIPSNVISGPLITAGSSTNTSTASASTLAGPAHATRNQSPNSQSLAISVPVKNEAFGKALQEFVDNLSDDDKVAFQSDTDVMLVLEELGKSRISRSHTPLMQKVQKVLQCVQQFLGSVAICIQHSPEISSLVVGGLNFVLTLALGYIEFFENLTDMMERIGDHLTYLSEYATGSIAFQNSEKVQKALVAAYCDLLGFYVKVRNLFTQRKLSYAHGFKRFLRVTWEPFEAHFQSIEARFIHHTDIVVRLAGAEQQIHFYKDKQRQEDESLRELRRKILEWLSPDHFEMTHERHFRKRFPGTGEWLLNDPGFIIWRDEGQSRLLWCYGAPGSGKTVLSSLVIDHLSALYELSPNVGITFIYCNYRESRSPLEYIRLAIKQLCRRIKPLPPKLSKAYEQHYQNHSQPSSQELQNIFLATVQQCTSVFFVLDALDECTLGQRAELCEFFAEIVELSTGTANGIVKLFVASRKELDIERAFLRKSFPKIEVQAAKVDRDIELFVKAQIKQRLQDGSLTLNNMKLKDKIFTALTTNAGGMFLWVEFQLKAICEQVSDYGIEETLQNIPEDIDATYERILGIIDKKPRAQRELARKALLFIAYAREPVSINLLALAIASSDHTKSLDVLRSSMSAEKVILNACGNLVSVDNTNFRRACFVHFSVHEFLTSHHRSKVLHTLSLEYEIAHREIARMCMIFLLILYSHIQDYCTDIERFFANDYILPAIPHHLLAGNLRSLPPNDDMIALILLFFGEGPPMLAPLCASNAALRTFFTFSPPVLALIFNLPGTYQCYNPQVLYEKQLDQKVLTWVHGRDYMPQYFVQVSDNRLAMHFAIGQLDSVAVAQRLYNHGYPVEYSYHKYDRPLNTLNASQDWVPDVCKLTPLYLVKSEGVARFLLDQGASVNPQTVNHQLPNLLGYVTEGGNTKVIRLLLDHGAEREEEAQSKALQSVASDGKVEAIRLLLDNGVDVNTQGGKFGNALQAAAYNGNTDAIGLLLDKGAEVNAQGGLYCNALQAATQRGHIGAMRLLLNRGADPNAQGEEDSPSALQVAANSGNVEAMRLLLEKGADVNVQNGYSNNVLQAAACGDNVEAMQLFLDEGADVNMQGGYYGSALQAAACGGNVETMQFLLDKGADVNAQCGEFGNALQAIAQNKSNIGIMQLLLDKGADVNAQGGRYGSALQATVTYGTVEAVQFLLDKGADVNLQGGKYGNALQAAALNGKVEVTQLLVDKGADVNAQGGEYGNALQAATSRCHIEVMQLLLDKGADANLQGGCDGNALQAAAIMGDVEAIRLLVDKGADINAQHEKHGNALYAATSRGNVEAIRLLLGEGADVNANGPPSNALGAAAFSGNVEALQLILDKGVDVNSQGGKYGNALQTAASYGRVEVMRLLVNKGADVNAQGGYYGNVLQAAVHCGKVEAVRLLMDEGADVTVQDGYYGNALQAAAVKGNVDIMRLLLDKGADASAQGGHYGNALQAAAYEFHVEAMQLLLDKGADFNAQGGYYGNALQAAAISGNVDGIRLLLGKGADVHARGGPFGTALQAALAPPDYPTKLVDDALYIARLLLDRGADITAYEPESKYGDVLSAAKELLGDDGVNLARLTKLRDSKSARKSLVL